MLQAGVPNHPDLEPDARFPPGDATAARIRHFRGVGAPTQRVRHDAGRTQGTPSRYWNRLSLISVSVGCAAGRWFPAKSGRGLRAGDGGRDTFASMKLPSFYGPRISTTSCCATPA